MKLFWLVQYIKVNSRAPKDGALLVVVLTPKLLVYVWRNTFPISPETQIQAKTLERNARKIQNTEYKNN